MDAREFIFTELRKFCRHEPMQAELAGFTWDDNSFLRTAIIRQQQGDFTAWRDFIKRLEDHHELAVGVRLCLEKYGHLQCDAANNRLVMGVLNSDTIPLSEHDKEALLRSLAKAFEFPTVADERPTRERDGRTAIMYIEAKPGLTGDARIGRVTFSQTRKTIYYAGYRFQSLKACGYKANFFNVDNGMQYWISNCRADGQDTLYPGIVEIDDDVREEYWLHIRNRPEMIDASSYRSEGKYSKRRPQPEKPNRPAAGPR